MKKLLAAIAAVVIVVVVVVLTRHGSKAAARPVNATPVAVAPATGIVASAATPSQVKRITLDQRRDLEQKIEASRAAHGQAATRAGERPQLPKMGKLEDLPPGVFDTVKQALPLLDACYNHGSKNYGPNLAVAQVTLHGAADVGTIVNADEFHDDKGAPIDKDVAECMASTLQSLQLPPIDMDVPVQFSFRY